MSEVWVVAGGFLLILLSGAPIAFAIGIASVLGFFVLGEDPAQVGSLVLGAMDEELLVAIPFYVLAGLLLARAGVIRPLLDLLLLLLGRFRGGMVGVTGVSSVVFGGMSGSGPAETAALSLIYVPPMEERGYPRAFAASLCAAGGTLGLVIPPSGGYILYALNSNGVSISDLFLAGVIPGIVMAICYIGMGLLVGRKYEKNLIKPPAVTWLSVGRLLPGSLLGLGAPIIILGGIYTGLTTVTESAAVAVSYALLVGCIVYRSLSLRDLYRVCLETGVATGAILLILAASSIFAWVVSVTGWARDASAALVEAAAGPTTFVLLAVLIFLIAGLVLDGVSMYFILLPLMLPAVATFDVDPIYFGVVITMAIAIGLVTPPLGLDLFAAASVMKVRYEALAKAVFPLVIGAFIALAIVIAFPALSQLLL